MISQAWILEWVVIPFSRDSSQPRDRTHVSCIGRWILYHLNNQKILLSLICGIEIICKEIQPVHCKWDQPWVFFGRNDAKAETSILWPPLVKSWFIGKDSDAGRDWGQEEKGMTKDEMARWHHWLDGRDFEWNPGNGDGQWGLACYSSWGHKESDTNEWLNWTERNEYDIAEID